MLREVFQVRVFISGPGDVEAEKSRVKYVCDEINQDFRDRCNVTLLPLEWRESVIPQLGPRPQEIINESIGDYEVFIGILWKRFGTPPGAHNPQTGAEYESGTEEEFEQAYEQWKQSSEPIINFYFKDKLDLKSPSVSELDQLTKVVKFKDKIKTEYRGWVVDFDDELDFERKVRRFLQTLCWNIQEGFGKKKSEPSASAILVKQHFEEVQSYLPRRVDLAEDAGSVKSSYLVYKNSQDTLTVVEQKNRVVLLSDAGAGKTTELQRIAAHFSKDESTFFPYLIRLNKYTIQNISDLLPEHWEKIPDKQLLILLDALDEVESQNRYNAIRQIELFAEQHPDAHIVVSCRSNFYKTETGLSSGSLKDFSSYILLNLNHSEVGEYLRAQLGDQKEQFERLISTNHLWSLLEIPFYLVRLVKQYREDGGLPESKAQLFERLLRDQVEFDVEHFRTTIDLEERRSTVIATLERVALAMETLGRNYISREEYERIIPDEQQRLLLKHCKAWKKTEGENQQWQFEHNNFQEYLAARVLSRQDIKTVQKFISFEPEYKKIIPTWINTISFLISILPRNGQLFTDLTTWILENQSEVVVKFERDKIEPSIRIELFKTIFDYYKKRQIPIDRDRFDYSELARFGQSDESADFLLDEAAQAPHVTTLANAIQLLGDSVIPYSSQQRVTRFLVGIALKTEAADFVRYNALMALADLRLNSQEVINEIVPALRSSDDEWLRTGLYYLLYNSDYLDENIDVFLEGLPYLGIVVDETTSSGIFARSRLFDEQWHLSVGLERVSTPTGVKKILTYFKEHASGMDRIYFVRTIEALAGNAARAYEDDSSILDLAIEFLVALYGTNDEGNVAAFMTFFDLTGTRLQAFKRILTERNKYRDALSVLALLAAPKCIEYFAQQYEERNITNDEVWMFQHHLGWARSDLYQSFNQLMNEISGNKFVLQPPRDIKGERKERRVNDINLLFDKEGFIREVKLIFETQNKDTLSKEDLFEIRKKQWETPTYSDLAVRTLSRMSNDSPISVERAVERINGWEWDLYRASVLYERLSQDESLTLTDDQKEVVAQWCYANLDKVDFKMALTTKAQGRGSTSWLAVFLWFFLRRFNLQYPTEVLLDMLSFDWIEGHHWVGIEYLESRLNQKEITERVLENLAAGIENDDVLKNHLNYCKRHSVKEAISFALGEVVNPDRDNVVRRTALETASELSEDLSNLEQALLTVPDEFKWNIVEYLIGRNSTGNYDFLLTTLANGSEEEQLKAAIYLIRSQDIKGLSFYVNWIKEHKKFPEDDVIGKALRALRTSEAIPLLMELLQVSYEEDLIQDDFHTLNRTVLDVLNNIALQSEENYKEVRRRITEFIQENISTAKNVNFLYQYSDSLERSYYINKSNQITLSEVIAKVTDVFDSRQAEGISDAT
jgi:predicted NACHT family NTPase